MPRFVVLYHEMPPGSQRKSHWDFMLEESGCLLTWALNESPFENDEITDILELPPHSLDYLTKEGPVSENRGSVKRVAAGQYELRPTIADVAVERLCSVFGNRLNGLVCLAKEPTGRWRWSIQRIEGDDS